MRKKRAAAMEALVQRCRSDADVPLRLDTLHGDAVHLKLNHRLPLEPGGGGGTRTQSVSRHMVQSGQFDAARRLRNAR